MSRSRKTLLILSAAIFLGVSVLAAMTAVRVRRRDHKTTSRSDMARGR